MRREQLIDKLLGENKTDYAIKKIAEHDWEDPQQLLKEIAEGLDVELPQKSPADFVEELDDSQDKCFVWQMDMTDTQIIDFTQKFQEEFIKKYNRDPQALHFIRNDVKNIEELDPDTVKGRVEPWLNNQEEK
ncbi:hypothetical protein OSG_eHP23_00195 [environmental Halophage eHP-23]|nr:hypothetical protein OSG_eHP23_00195 [environmental Halophage eHP-23]